MNILRADYVIDHKGVTSVDPWLVNYKNQYFKLNAGNVCTVWYRSKLYLIAKSVHGVEYIIDVDSIISIQTYCIGLVDTDNTFCIESDETIRLEHLKYGDIIEN